MIGGSEKRNLQLAFVLQNSHVCEKRSNKYATLHIQLKIYKHINPLQKLENGSPLIWFQHPNTKRFVHQHGT